MNKFKKGMLIFLGGLIITIFAIVMLIQLLYPRFRGSYNGIDNIYVTNSVDGEYVRVNVSQEDKERIYSEIKHSWINVDYFVDFFVDTDNLPDGPGLIITYKDGSFDIWGCSETDHTLYNSYKYIDVWGKTDVHINSKELLNIIERYTRVVDGSIKKYIEKEDGTWECEGNIYKYKLEVTGRMGNATKESSFIYLSNLDKNAFDQAWKNAGESSNIKNYIDIKDAVLVDWTYEENINDNSGDSKEYSEEYSEEMEWTIVEDGAKYMIEEYGFTEEELDGYDVTAFVNELLLDRPSAENARLRFEDGKEFYRITDEYLFNKKTAFMDSRNYSEQVTEEDKIAKIGYTFYVNNEHETFIYILDEGLMYYTSVGMGEYRKATIDEGVVESLSNIIENYDIDTWENKYNGPNRNTTGYVGWELCLELNDGRVICYSGGAESSSDFSNDMLSLERRLTGYRYLISE